MNSSFTAARSLLREYRTRIEDTSVLRGISPIIAAQAFGAGVQGVGFAALRLRTNTIWPLIAIHALHDLFLQMGTLPIPLIEVPIDTILLVYGIFLLRHGDGAGESAPSEALASGAGSRYVR
jgi:hypothetical protein